MSSDTFPYMYIVVCSCLVWGKKVTAQETGSELHLKSVSKTNMIKYGGKCGNSSVIW